MSSVFFLDLRQNVREGAVDADGAVLDSVRRTRVPRIQAGVYGARVPVRHVPEGVLDDARGVPAHAQLQKQHLFALGFPQKRLVPSARRRR